MHEETINGKRVVFRDTIPAKYGWKLIGPMNRLSQALNKRREEILAQTDGALPDETIVIPGDEVVAITQEALSWDAIIALVRGSVSEWDMVGDLTKDTCCDELDALNELFPIIVEARRVFFGLNVRGEAAGASTNT